MKMPTFFPIFLILSLCSQSPSAAAIVSHNRRTLHQPFFPLHSIPPSPLPSPSPTTDLPFSSSTPAQQPFFPSPPSPPSPSSSASASFPANISSLILPQTPKPKPKPNSKLVSAAVALLASAAIVAAVALFLCIRRRRHGGLGDDKTNVSDNSSNRLFHFGAVGRNHKMRRSIPTASDLLYLGTVVNSCGGIDSHVASNGHGGGSGCLGHSRKLYSPELQPLPPLNNQQLRQSHGNANAGCGGDDEDEEFYSPRGSLGRQKSSMSTGSASRRMLAGIVAENFEKRSSGSSCSSSSSSSSGSPDRSLSMTASPPVNLTPIPKSPELVPVQVAPPPPPPPPSPPVTVSLSNQSDSPSFSPSPSQHLSSPDRSPTKSHVSSPRRSNVSNQSLESETEGNTGPRQLALTFSDPSPPPLPPPLPQSIHSGTPVCTPSILQHVLKPPVLVTPSRPITIRTPTLISPMELPPSLITVDSNEETPKPKLKPLHWEKLSASPDREMLWDQLNSSSFKLNEEMIETLFLVNTPNSNPKDPARHTVLPSPDQENMVLDPKKSQSIAISLKALNVTAEEVCEALLEGNADALGTELLECLLKMAPTKEEERKLTEYKEDSTVKLGPAERFLKAVLNIPFAFRRVDVMLYATNFGSKVERLKKSFENIEAACEELRESRMFLKLLEAVLKTGNHMNVGTNGGDAQACKLDTLLKLVDVKGADGKTSLLHFVVQEMIKSEGARLSVANQNPKSAVNDDTKCRKLGLQVVSSLSSELANVKTASAMDSDMLSSDVLKLSNGIRNIAGLVQSNEAIDPKGSTKKFSESMKRFMIIAEEEIIRIQAQESVARSLVKEITEYFDGDLAKEEAHPFRIFMVVSDFLTILEQVCEEVGTINERTMISVAHKFPVPVNPTLPLALGGFPESQQYSSYEGSSSP